MILIDNTQSSGSFNPWLKLFEFQHVAFKMIYGAEIQFLPLVISLRHGEK